MTLRAQIPSPQTHPGGVTRYRDHILDELRHDPYQAKKKYAHLTTCPGCGLVFEDGRWHKATVQGAGSAGDVPKVECPACRRIADKLPAGFLTLAGPLLAEHRVELLSLASNIAAAEAEDHPLHRVMAITQTPDEVLITTTDLHLPRRIGEALRRAHGGRFEMKFAEDEFLMRARWFA